MFTWLVYLLVACSIIFIGLAILSLVILHATKKLKENTDKDKKDKAIYSFFKNKRFLVTIILTVSIIFSYISFSLAVAVNNFNDQMASFASLYTILFGNKDCICYAKCTDDAETDNKCTYELLFGPVEYERLVNAYNASDKETKDFLLDINASGREKGNILKEDINDAMVQCYKDIVGYNSSFRHGDNKDRSQMTDEELKEDLRSLLSDYKVNGINPNCKCCRNEKKDKLNKKCLGEPHYVAGWSWGEIWESDDTYTPDAGGTSSSLGSHLGNATGQYTITLDDGLSYYWYHQAGSCGCTHCGNWSKMEWGAGDNWRQFSEDGCAVYSLAMIVSNLTGEEITPLKLLETLGCTITTKSDGRLRCDTSTSSCFVGRGIKREAAAGIIQSTYGISYDIVNSESEISSALLNEDIDALGWDQWADKSNKTTWLHGGSDFEWYGGTGHFMVIRKEDAGNWYCLTSTGSNGKTHAKIMNTPESPSNVFNHSTGGTKFVFHIDKPVPDTSGSGNIGEGTGSSVGSIPTNSEVVAALQNNSKYSDKAQAMAYAYSAAMQAFGNKNIAIGLAANVYAEGNIGLIEGIWNSSKESAVTLSCKHGEGKKRVYPYWGQVGCEVHDLAQTTITNHQQIQTMLTIPSGVSGIGVGSIQWSGSRRVNLLNKYNSLGEITTGNLARCEIEYMIDELRGTFPEHNYSGVIKNCSGKTASECARTICKEYEAPSDANNKAVQRAQVASELESILSDL